MKEVKTPKKPLAIYYAIVLLVLMLLNFVLVPWMSERQVKEVDYGTFMSMTEDKDIGRVDVESNQIIFTDKDEKQIYKTGLMNDPDLTQRLYDAGARVFQRDCRAGFAPDELSAELCAAHRPLRLSGQFHEQKAHGKGRRRELNDVRRRG